jgi:outer membrane protein
MKTLLSFALLLFVPVSMASADLKVATIDLGKAFDNYYKTREDAAHLKEKEAEAQKEVSDKNTDYQHVGDEVQKLEQESKDPTLSPEARAERDKAFRQRGADLTAQGHALQAFVNERKSELQDEYVRRRKEVVEAISKVINEYAAAQGYDLVLDKSSASAASSVPLVLFSSNKLVDITADIIAKENVGAPATVPGAAPAAPAAGATN